MTRLLLLAALLPLAACGGGEDAGNNSSDQATTTTEPIPSNATIDPQNTVVPLPPSPSPSPVAASGFPAAFQGRWGMVPNDCDPAQDFAAKGLMVVGADRLTFYEARATPTRIEQTTPTRLVAELSFTGEGQQWTRRSTMQIQDGGRTLVREESDPAGSFRYSRCPG